MNNKAGDLGVMTQVTLVHHRGLSGNRPHLILPHPWRCKPGVFAMRTRLLKLLLDFLSDNNGKLPSEVRVAPLWTRAVREFLAEIDLDIPVRTDAALDDDDVRLVA